MIKYICAIAVLTTAMAFAKSDPAIANIDQAGINKEVRHELIMLPYLGVFDNLAYRVDGNIVTLTGQVTRPTLKAGCRTSGEAYRRSGSSGQSNRGSAGFSA